MAETNLLEEPELCRSREEEPCEPERASGKSRLDGQEGFERIDRRPSYSLAFQKPLGGILVFPLQPSKQVTFELSRTEVQGRVVFLEPTCVPPKKARMMAPGLGQISTKIEK